MTVEPDWKPVWNTLIEQCTVRLKMGREQYKGQGFKKTISSIIGEFREEICDSIIYLFMLYYRWAELENAYEYAKEGVIDLLNNKCPHCKRTLS
jgi:hypothetical protein